MTRNHAFVTVEHGEGDWLIATCNPPGDASMGRLRTALNAIPDIADATTLDEPGKMQFKIHNPPPLKELADELTAWVA